MAKTFTKQTIKKLVVAGNDTKQIHLEYLNTVLKLPRESSRLSDSEYRRERLINKLHENGFVEISGEMLAKYMKLYTNRWNMREGLVMHKDGHSICINILATPRWSEPSVQLFDIDRFEDTSLKADTAEQAIYAVDNFDKVEEDWRKTWSVEEAKVRKLLEVNQNTLDMVLKGIVKKHNWTYCIEKDGNGRTTLLIRLSGRRQITMKFKKEVSTEVITKVAEVISQLVEIIKNNDDIEIMVRGVSIKTKWTTPE